MSTYFANVFSHAPLPPSPHHFPLTPPPAPPFILCSGYRYLPLVTFSSLEPAGAARPMPAHSATTLNTNNNSLILPEHASDKFFDHLSLITTGAALRARGRAKAETEPDQDGSKLKSSHPSPMTC